MYYPKFAPQIRLNIYIKLLIFLFYFAGVGNELPLTERVSLRFNHRIPSVVVSCITLLVTNKYDCTSSWSVSTVIISIKVQTTTNHRKNNDQFQLTLIKAIVSHIIGSIVPQLPLEYILIEGSIGCFQIKVFRLYGHLNDTCQTTHCSFIFVKKNNVNYNFEITSIISTLSVADSVVLFYFSCVSNTCVICTKCIMHSLQTRSHCI